MRLGCGCAGKLLVGGQEDRSFGALADGQNLAQRTCKTAGDVRPCDL